MRWLVLTLAAVLVTGRPALAADDVWREQSQKTVDVRGITALEIENSRGRVEVLPSPDGRLHITALKIVRVGRRERGEDVARGIVVETEARAGHFRVDVRYQRHSNIQLDLRDLFSFHGNVFPRHEVRIAAEVPAGLSVMVREGSGDIRSEGIAGPQELRTSSGDIEIRSAGDRVDAWTSSGDVSATGIRRAHVSSMSGDLEIHQVAGALRASTSSGDISVSGAEDSLSLSSVSGDIEADRAPRGLRAESTSGGVVVRGASGTVKAGTVSGELTIGLREPLAGAELGTTSGEIQLELDPAIRCALDLRTSSGSLDVRLPMQMSNVSRRSVTGTIGGGRTPVVLHTASGDITVTGGGR